MARPSNIIEPEPFLKWAGGKGQLLGTLARHLPHSVPGYHEPFVGSGALFFHLHRTGGIRGQAWLSDVNPTLVGAWRAVRDHVDELVERLKVLAAAHDPRDPGPTYYAARERFNAIRQHQTTERAALLIYLNRTGFNGLYRERADGAFNVPVGRYANPSIVREASLRATSAALKAVEIEERPFDERLRDEVRAGDLVYFDPPYEPLNATSSFTSYAKGGFGQDDQRRLAALFEELTERGVRCMLSNSSAPLIRELYGDLERRHRQVRVTEVSATRMINSKADKRGSVTELLVVNFRPDEG